METVMVWWTDVVKSYMIIFFCRLSYTVLSSPSYRCAVTPGEAAEQAWSHRASEYIQYVVVVSADSVLQGFFLVVLCLETSISFAAFRSSWSMSDTTVCQDPVTLVAAPSVVMWCWRPSGSFFYCCLYLSVSGCKMSVQCKCLSPNWTKWWLPATLEEVKAGCH